MNQDTKLLRQIYHNTEIGKSGLRAAMKVTRDPSMQRALTDQLWEYEAIRAQAGRLLKDRGTPAKKIPELLSALTRTRAEGFLVRGRDASGIAERIIHNSTQGMVRSIRQNRSAPVLDPKVSSLSNRLLQTELAGIEQMKAFL